MKVLVSDSIAEEGIRILKREAEVDVLTKLSKEELIKVIKNYDALVVRSATQVTREVIEAGDRLKVIGRAGVGVDNIDVDAATEKGIIVLNAPEGNTIAAAEHTIGMILALARNIPQANASLKAKKWEKSKFLGVEIYDKVLGIIGLGRIGSEVAKRCQAFGMRILAYDPYISEEKAKALGVKLTTLDEILKNADFITIHTPLTKETQNLIGAKEFEKMKKGVRIINCARGGIIDEEALYSALKSGKVAGAALDVFAKEPPLDSPLLTLDNVIVTPHLGASTAEAQINVAISVAEQVLNALKGEVVKNAVNAPAIGPEVMEAIRPYLPLAEKIGKFLAQVVKGYINQVEISYSGEIAEKDTKFLTIAVLKGLLEPVLCAPVTYVNAMIIAKNRGIKVFESKSPKTEDFANLISVTAKSDIDQRRAAGTIFGKRDARIVLIDKYRVDAIPSGYMVISNHIDKPGVIGKIGTLLGKNNINIAGMIVGREYPGGPAVMVLAVDSFIPDEILKQFLDVDGVKDAELVKL